jgi:hypothetical protein
MKEERDHFWEKNLKVQMVWNVEPQKMLDYILEADRSNGLHKEEDYSITSYIGKPLKYIREVYEDYNGLDSLTDDELIENEYYRLEIA